MLLHEVPSDLLIFYQNKVYKQIQPYLLFQPHLHIFDLKIQYIILLQKHLFVLLSIPLNLYLNNQAPFFLHIFEPIQEQHQILQTMKVYQLFLVLSFFYVSFHVEQFELYLCLLCVQNLTNHPRQVHFFQIFDRRDAFFPYRLTRPTRVQNLVLLLSLLETQFLWDRSI